MESERNISRLVAEQLAAMGLSDPVMAEYYLCSLYESPRTSGIVRWLSIEEAKEAARLVEFESARLRFGKLLAA